MASVYGQVDSNGSGTINAAAYTPARISKGQYQVNCNEGSFDAALSVVVTLLGRQSR